MSGNAEGPIVVGDLVEAIDTGETGRVRAIFEVKIEGGPPMPDMIIIMTDEAAATGIIRDRPRVRRKVVVSAGARRGRGTYGGFRGDERRERYGRRGEAGARHARSVAGDGRGRGAIADRDDARG